MCRRTRCQHAISCDNVNVVLHCSFYPSLKDLPVDCRVPEILREAMTITKTDTEEIIELIEEFISK